MSTKRKYKIKRVNECLSDNQIEDVCYNTDLCNNNTQKLSAEIIDIEVMRERLMELRLEVETDKNNMRFFENQILIRLNEIERLENKIHQLEQ